MHNIHNFLCVTKYYLEIRTQWIGWMLILNTDNNSWLCGTMYIEQLLL